jgi:ankyrin repeat protein
MKRYRIHAAAGSSAPELETLLGTKEHDVNMRDRNRTTPLHHAVYYNKTK